MAITKTHPPELINLGIEHGLTVIGENRVQEYLAKRPNLLPHEFHLVGHLQRNKVKSILPYCSVIHSLDSPRLAEEIQTHAAALSRTVDVLIEVNTSGEESKFGVQPSAVGTFLASALRFPNLRVIGLMTVAEPVEDAERVRPAFRALRLLLERLRAELRIPHFRHLSMGMSGDFEVAIEEGATLIRLGSVLFGQRH